MTFPFFTHRRGAKGVLEFPGDSTESIVEALAGVPDEAPEPRVQTGAIRSDTVPVAVTWRAQMPAGPLPRRGQVPADDPPGRHRLQPQTTSRQVLGRVLDGLHRSIQRDRASRFAADFHELSVFRTTARAEGWSGLHADDAGRPRPDPGLWFLESMTAIDRQVAAARAQIRSDAARFAREERDRRSAHDSRAGGVTEEAAA